MKVHVMLPKYNEYFSFQLELIVFDHQMLPRKLIDFSQLIFFKFFLNGNKMYEYLQ